MTKKQEGLQKVTKDDYQLTIEEARELEEITATDMLNMPPDEREAYWEEVCHSLNNLKGVEKADLIHKVRKIMPRTTKNQLWEINHDKITWAIADYTQDYGRTPSVQDLAKMTELSRPTVYKHLDEFDAHNMYKLKKKEFVFMADKVLSKMFQYALNGDVSAARLFLKATGTIDTLGPNTVQTQNNYIQINGMTISQDVIEKMSKDQLSQFSVALESVGIVQTVEEVK